MKRHARLEGEAYHSSPTVNRNKNVERRIGSIEAIWDMEQYCGRYGGGVYAAVQHQCEAALWDAKGSEADHNMK